MGGGSGRRGQQREGGTHRKNMAEGLGHRPDGLDKKDRDIHDSP